ncbi:uncharacterized protein PFL1_02868 [Pseudozyma flocculosa PF-1]|uniref:Uncharacterized protein n=2 Tax=Pseudozyma flocculosa TaxID=84751 RepID=A0A5C3F2T7_9BASI|nr:uncharacterized protein PFL1_02868 [Pseudozyma flocculosa PF-1]EPQ29648.1 hypothetical protein PFL1_02868 [Pseudozyma flocculosa PF-1]SPO38216.1 uncharacterized protein PSFLO_03693 [Pseudozyma flocculosa]
MPAVAPSGHQRPPGADRSNKLKPLPPPTARDDEDETTTDDDSSDEDAALEMDGQELWTQNYCATCDCLIEPGEGLAGAGAAEAAPTPHTSLKSRSGTIKARGPDGGSDVAQQQNPHGPNAASKGAAATSNTSSNGNKGADLKRTNSAGRLHARGPNGPLGPHKRTGSAGSRLNALSELRPTTKLHPTQDDVKGKGKASSGQEAKGPGRRSPAISRRGSSASVKSLNHSGSGPSSTKSDDGTGSGPVKPKSRGFLGGLTPAALKQQQAEMAEKKRAPTQLYCSERCRAIDQNRSTGLGELTQYLSQPLQPVAPAAAWVSGGGWVVGPAASQWPRSTSLSSVSIPYVTGTPESECMCADCLDKCADGGSAGGATVPSGASDTTESSGGYIYGRPATRQKMRTASGRIVTPLNLHPPGSSPTVDSYFPAVPGHPSHAKRDSTSSLRSRPGDGAGHDADRHRSNPVPSAAATVRPPPRTASTGPVGSASTADTESSGSHVSLWEPKLRRPSEATGSGTIKRTSPSRRPVRAHGSESLNSGRTTVTATPAITPRQSMMSQQPLAPLSSDRHPSGVDAQVMPVPTVTHSAGHRTELSSGGAATRNSRAQSTSTASASAASFATSPLNLLRGSSVHQHAAPSVDVWNEHVGSPPSALAGGVAATHASLLSRSLASSENTLPGSSSITVSGQKDDARQRHQSGQSSHAAAASDKRATTANIDIAQGMGRTSSRDAEGRRNGGEGRSMNELSLAVGSLKLAQTRAHQRHASTSLYDDHPPKHSRRLSLFGPVTATAERRPSTGTSGSNSGWFRSISSAWATLRGAPAELDRMGDLESGRGGDDGVQEAGSVEHAVMDQGSRARTGPASSSRSTVQFREPAAPLRRGTSSQGSSRTPAEASSSLPEHKERPDATPTQSLVAKPTIRRGRVPAFVKEIGHGEIPGDATDNFGVQGSSYRSATDTAIGASPESRSREGSLSRVATAADEEKARRRQERKEASRQRRSRDIHVLPPLLAPISRNSSSTNLLYGNAPHSARGTSHGRPRTHSTTPQMVVGSAGSNVVQHVAVPPHRSTTPGFVGHSNGPPSPAAMMRSPFQGAFPPIVGADGRTIVSPSRPGSAAGYYSTGTSPRAKGLGWGAMTSIAAAPLSAQLPGTGGHHHPQHHHSTSIGYGHAAAVASRATQHAAHRHSHHAGHGHGHGHHQVSHGAHGAQRGAHPVRHNTSLQLGTLGMLGAHPHGHAPVVGRHSTMPHLIKRSPTPSVPEDGGEMTSQDLTSGDFIPRPNSAMTQAQRSRAAMMPPPRSRSSMGVDSAVGHRQSAAASVQQHAHEVAGDASGGLGPAHAVAQPERPASSQNTWSYEALPGLKTYPVLQLPNRETHDVYDQGWGLDSGGLAKHLTGRAQREDSEGAPIDGQADGGPAPPQHRKKLFYFDA